MKECHIAFIGAGAVAAYHAYALTVLPFYYADAPRAELVAVTSATESTRQAFAARYGFRDALAIDDLAKRSDIDSVYIVSPNAAHYEHMQLVGAMPHVRRVLIEKPLCVSEEEARGIEAGDWGATRAQLGFQYLQSSVVREAHRRWRGGELGTPVHFQARYLHSGYLDPAYRARRASRLKAAPEGGAMVDLGSHAFSLAAAFLGNGLEVVDAMGSGAFPDVESDLCTIALCRDRASGAAGTVTASRVSAGAGELLELELRGTRGGFRFSTEDAETLEVFSTDAGESRLLRTASHYAHHNEFPKRPTLGGWLRSMVHASYLFLTDAGEPPSADLRHGLTVQRLLHETARRIVRR
jgi:predicted dehydrogenase